MSSNIKLNSNSINTLLSEIIACKEVLLNNVNEKGIIKIEDEIKDKIFHLIGKNSKHRDILKIAIKKVLNLSEKDAIIYLNDKIVIKLFERNREKRFCGLPPEELAILKEKLFESEEEIESFVIDVVEDLLSKELSFKRISNIYFMNNYIKFVQQGIFTLLNRKFNEEKIVIESMTNYIVRESFNLILEVMSNNLLKLIMKKDENAQEFINYYNGEIEVDTTGRYKRPEIVDEENRQRWKSSHVVTITNSYNLFLKNVKKIDRNIKYLQMEVEKLKRENLKNKLEESLRDLTQEENKKNKVLKTQESTQQKFERAIRVIAKTLHKKRIKV